MGQRAIKDEDSGHPVASAWRPTLKKIVEAFVRGDYGLKKRIPLVAPIPPATARQMKQYVAEYGETLCTLPDDTWSTSVAQWMGPHWEVLSISGRLNPVGVTWSFTSSSLKRREGFGSRSTSSMSPNASDSSSVQLVVAPPAAEKALAILASWSWLLPTRIRAVGVNRFGDWYLQMPDGTVSLLSIWEGTFAPVALSFDEWREWLATEDGIETNWGELVMLLYDRGKILGDEECFAFVPPPLGGVGIDVDRIVTMPIGAITATMAQTFQQLGRAR